MKASEAAALAGMLAGSYPGRRITDATIAMYAAALQDLDYTAASAAVSDWVLNEPEWPAISELRARTFKRLGGAVPDADQAWAEVQREIRRVGYLGEPRWSHRAIAEAVTALGWVTLCQSDNPPADRAHFFKLYAATGKRAADRRNEGAVAILTESVARVLSGTGREPAQLPAETKRRK